MLPLITGEMETNLRGRGSDLYRIRDYEPEDSARHVDWKATAKSGELKVREYTREDERSLCIVFDNPAPGVLDTAHYERAINLAASIAWHFFQDNTELRFAAPELSPDADVYAFLEYLALVAPRPHAESDDFLSTLAGIGTVQHHHHGVPARHDSHPALAIFLGVIRAGTNLAHLFVSGFQRRMGLRAAAVSSRRERRVECGALRDEVGRVDGLLRDGLHGIDEAVEFFQRLALGGLDHERAGDDHGEADGVGMEAVVDEALGDVSGLDAELGLELVAEDDLVHGGRVRREGRRCLRVFCAGSWR